MSIRCAQGTRMPAPLATHPNPMPPHRTAHLAHEPARDAVHGLVRRAEDEDVRVPRHLLQVAGGHQVAAQVHARQVLGVHVVRVDDVQEGAALWGGAGVGGFSWGLHQMPRCTPGRYLGFVWSVLMMSRRVRPCGGARGWVSDREGTWAGEHWRGDDHEFPRVRRRHVVLMDGRHVGGEGHARKGLN